MDYGLVAMSMAMILLALTAAPCVPVARGSGISAAHPAYSDAATAYDPAASVVECRGRF